MTPLNRHFRIEIKKMNVMEKSHLANVYLRTVSSTLSNKYRSGDSKL